MIKSNNLIKKLVIDTFVYKCVLIIMAFCYVLPITTSYTTGVLKVALIWGLIIFVCNIIKKHQNTCFQNVIRIEYMLIGLFVFFAALSSVVNFQDRFIRNAVDVAYLIITACIPLVIDKSKNISEIFRELKAISCLVIIVSFLITLSTFVIYVTGYQGAIEANETEYILGFVEGRLYGIIGNPNSSALLAFFSVTYSVLVLNLLRKDIMFSVLVYINIVLQVIVFSLTNSRSAMVSMGATIMVYIFLFLLKRFSFCKIASIGLSFIISISAFFVFYGVTQLARETVAWLPSTYNVLKYKLENIDYTETNDINEIESSNNSIENDQQNRENITSINEPHISAVDTDREYKTSDVSNGRLEIWRAGLAVARKNLLFGVGTENVQQRILSFLSTEIASNSPGIASNMHNIYLQILVENGICALLCFMSFFVCLIIKATKCFFRMQSNKDMSKVVCVLLCTIIGVLVENLFDSNLIGFNCLFVVPLFWIQCGYLLALMNHTSKEIR